VRLENNFEVPVPVERAWEVLLDIERVAPCMPGATLTSHEGDDFTGTVKVKLGPVSLTYKGKGRFVEKDEAARRVKLNASGADARGAGTAQASVTATLVPIGASGPTRVEVVTDLDITGKAAQFGRGLIGDVSGKLIGQFADCLAGTLGADADTAPVVAAVSEAASPDTTVPPVAPPTPAEAARSAPVAAAPVAAAPVAAAPKTASPAPVAEPAPPQEAEAIDLLAVTGVGGAVRRAVPYVVTAAASFCVVLGVIWWIRRR
jgi:carbon monoxide dehydrogenase subunit G